MEVVVVVDDARDAALAGAVGELDAGAEVAAEALCQGGLEGVLGIGWSGCFTLNTPCEARRPLLHDPEELQNAGEIVVVVEVDRDRALAGAVGELDAGAEVATEAFFQVGLEGVVGRDW